MLLYYIILIAALTLVFWLLHRAKLLQFCPICAAVVVTWLGGLIALYSDSSFANPLLIAILMAASMGALAERYGNRLGLLGKSALVLLGTPAIYLLVNKELTKGLLLIFVLIIISLVNKSGGKPKNNHNDIFKSCC
jgi:hypothetical protein